MDSGDFAVLIDGIEQLAYVAFGICLVGFVVIGLVWVMKILVGSRMSKADAAALRDVDAKLAVMERRMGALEKILDVEVPAWRVGFDEIGEGYGRKVG